MRYFLLIFMLLSFNVNADNLSDSNKLFDWAEENFPEFFSPAGQDTFAVDVYLARYYPSTGNYLGTSGNDVYVLGDPFGGLVKVGVISDFIDLSESGAASDTNLTISGDDTVDTGTEFSLPDIEYRLVELSLNGFRSLSLIASRFTSNPGEFFQNGVSFAAGLSEMSGSDHLVYTAAIQINVSGDSYQYVFENECILPCDAPPFVIDESSRTVTLNNLRMEADDASGTVQTSHIFLTGTLSWTQDDES